MNELCCIKHCRFVYEQNSIVNSVRVDVGKAESEITASSDSVYKSQKLLVFHIGWEGHPLSVTDSTLCDMRREMLLATGRYNLYLTSPLGNWTYNVPFYPQAFLYIARKERRSSVTRGPSIRAW